MTAPDESIGEHRGPDRPVRRTHGLGIFCTVCISRGEPRDIYEFPVDTDRIETLREKSWSEKKKEERIQKEREKPRKEFVEHWNENHW